MLISFHVRFLSILLIFIIFAPRIIDFVAAPTANTGLFYCEGMMSATAGAVHSFPDLAATSVTHRFEIE